MIYILLAVRRLGTRSAGADFARLQSPSVLPQEHDHAEIIFDNVRVPRSWAERARFAQ